MEPHAPYFIKIPILAIPNKSCTLSAQHNFLFFHASFSSASTRAASISFAVGGAFGAVDTAVRAVDAAFGVAFDIAFDAAALGAASAAAAFSTAAVDALLFNAVCAGFDAAVDTFLFFDAAA